MDADGYSDPYVKISLGKQRFKSKVKYRTLNPTFKENFNLKFNAGDTTGSGAYFALQSRL